MNNKNRVLCLYLFNPNSSFTHKINNKYFYKTHYLLKNKYLNYCALKCLVL